MKNISSNMDNACFSSTEKITAIISKHRNSNNYEKAQFYNLLQKRKIISRQLKKESGMVKEESMKVLAEFENL